MRFLDDTRWEAQPHDTGAYGLVATRCPHSGDTDRDHRACAHEHDCRHSFVAERLGLDDHGACPILIDGIDRWGMRHDALALLEGKPV